MQYRLLGVQCDLYLQVSSEYLEVSSEYLEVSSRRYLVASNESVQMQCEIIFGGGQQRLSHC